MEEILPSYIAITIAVFRPLDCYDRPNEMNSMLSLPGVICGEDDRTSLVTISAFAILAYLASTSVNIYFFGSWAASQENGGA